MGDKAREEIRERIERSRKRIETLRSRGADTAQLTIIFNKIETASRTGNVKEENLSEAVKKLENLLQVTERIRERPKEGKKKVEKEGKGHPDFQQEMKPLEDLQAQVKALGGDLSPIFHHIEAINEAAKKGDREVFSSYRDTVKPWLHEYLFSLKKAKLSDLQGRVKGVIEGLVKWGREDLADPLRKELAAIDPLVRSAGDDIDIVIRDLEAVLEMSGRANSELGKDLKVRVEARQNEVRTLLEVKEPKFDKSSFRELLGATTRMAEEGEYEKAIEALAARTIDLKRIVHQDKVETLNRFLDLLDPVIARVGESMGKESEVYIRLKERRDEIKGAGIERIEEALSDVERLLDEAARASAEAEEGALKALQSRVDAMIKDMEAHPGPDAHGVIKLAEKVQSLLIEGDLQAAAKAMEKAEVSYRNLISRRERALVESDIIAVRSSISDKMAKGKDVRSLEEGMARAQESILAGSLEEARAIVGALKKALEEMDSHMRREEIRKLGSEISSEIEELGPTGRVPEAQRRLAEAIERAEADPAGSHVALTDLRASIKAERTVIVLKERMDEIRAMMREAQAFGLETKRVEDGIALAEQALKGAEIEKAMEAVTKAKVDLESMIRERSVKRIENEIEIIASEMRRMNMITGDYKAKISSAYDLVEKDRTEEAVSILTDLKNDLEKKLTSKRVLSMMDSLDARIREARMHNIEISSYKADRTKAKVRFDAGDMDGALKDLIQSLKGLEEALERKKAVRSKMDALRGALISLDAKLTRLASRGLDIDDHRGRLARLRALIEAGDENGAKVIAEALDNDVSSAFRDLPVIAISEGPLPQTRTPPERGPRPSIEIVRADEAPRPKGEQMDPNEARKRLQILLTRIGKAVQMGGPKAQEQCRSDLERIKQLIVKRDYHEAYRIALDCLKRLGG